MKLDGVKVLDLSLFLPGPLMTQAMADHGAEVIKVEPPGEGEPNRHIGAEQDGTSVYFRNTHRGKKSVCINLKNPAGRAALLRLASQADVFVEAFRPGVVDRLGVGYEVVAALNPRIIYCSIAAFGQDGPYRDLPAHDLGVEAFTGLVSCNLGNDGKPTMPHIPAADATASLSSLAAIAMALYRREKTGRGDYLDIAMYDTLMAWTANVLGDVFAHRRPPVVKHERTFGGSGFYNIYETADGRHVVLGAQELKFVRNLLTEFDALEFVPLCERGPGAHQKPLIDFLRGKFRQRTQTEWIEWFQGRDISFAPVKNLREAMDDPQAQARAMHLLDEDGREHLGSAFKFRDEPAKLRLKAPKMGADTDSVLAAAGYSAAEIAAMRAEGALGG
ncbi:MAG: CaiB/BaiF CoA-transferase family protein [Steroidobacteraceae bacterium]